jgi:hypothetical protein
MTTKQIYTEINEKLAQILAAVTVKKPAGMPGATDRSQILPVIVTEKPKSTGGNWNLYPDPSKVYQSGLPPAGKMWLYNSESGERIAVTPCGSTLGG